MAIKSFHNTFNFCEEAIKVNILLQAFPELLRLLKLHKSILYLVTVIINHLVKHYFFSKNPLFIFLRIQLNMYNLQQRWMGIYHIVILA